MQLFSEDFRAGICWDDIEVYLNGKLEKDKMMIELDTGISWPLNLVWKGAFWTLMDSEKEKIQKV